MLKVLITICTCYMHLRLLANQLNNEILSTTTLAVALGAEASGS